MQVYAVMQRTDDSGIPFEFLVGIYVSRDRAMAFVHEQFRHVAIDLAADTFIVDWTYRANDRDTYAAPGAGEWVARYEYSGDEYAIVAHTLDTDDMPAPLA